jgi:hypothetical protein
MPSHSTSHHSSSSSHPGGHPSSSSAPATGGHGGGTGGGPAGTHSEVSYDTMENFGQHLNGVQGTIFSGADKMQSLNWGAHTFGAVGQAFTPGVSSTTSHAAQQMHSVGNSVGQASHGVTAMSNNYRNTEQSIAGVFHGLHDPQPGLHTPHATGSGSGSGSGRPPRRVGFDQQTTEHHPDGSQSTGVLGGGNPTTRPHGAGSHPQNWPADWHPGQPGHPAPNQHGAGLDPQNYTPITGANTHSITGDPESGNHPLKVNDSGLTTASYLNSQNLVNHYNGQNGNPGKGKRPGMGGALLAGDQVIPHSSMKHDTGGPNRHGALQNVLDNAPQHLLDRPQHGKCAEMGAISDYLHHQDPHGTWTQEDAKHHFEQVGATTTAHRPENNGEPADPCPSCEYVTGQLGINWYTRPVWEAHG